MTRNERAPPVPGETGRKRERGAREKEKGEEKHREKKKEGRVSRCARGWEKALEGGGRFTLTRLVVCLIVPFPGGNKTVASSKIWEEELSPADLEKYAYFLTNPKIQELTESVYMCTCAPA